MKSPEDCKPEIVRTNLVCTQVCVPKDWTREQIEEFANTANPTGISSKWSTMTEEEWRQRNAPHNDPLRLECEDKPNYIHTVLTC